MRSLAFQVDGSTLKGDLYEPRAAKGSTPLLVLAHGMSSSRREWYDFPQLLANAGMTVVAFDFRGHGESEGERGVQSVARAREDIAAAIRAGLAAGRGDSRRVALIGHSLGASLSIAAASDLPLRCLVALAPAARLRAEMNLFEFVGYNAARGLNAPLTLLYKPGIRVPYKVRYQDLYEDSKAVERARADDFLQRTLPVKNYRTLVAELDTEASARRLNLPVLVVVADRDKIIQPENSRKVYRALAGPKRLVEMAGSGHSMAGDIQRERVATVVLDFLQEHLAGAKA